MSIKNPLTPAEGVSRRHMIVGVAVALGGLVSGFDVEGRSEQQPVKATPPTAANQTRTSLHQEIDFKAKSQRIYEILLDSKLFAAFTGMPADIDSKEGGAFSTFGGLIAGRNVELVPNARIVQAWRPTHWDPGVYSIVRFELKPQGSETQLVLDHTGFPEGEFDHLNPGWALRYWDPLKKYLT